MKIIFWGSPEFAVPFLEALLRKGFSVPLVVTQPDKIKGRGKKVSPTPVKEFALEHGLQVETPDRLRGNKEFLKKIKELEPEFYVVVAYGKFLPSEFLQVPVKAPINVHASLLPRYRGAAPMQWAIMNGERETGITIMIMNEKMDEGDILLQERVPIRFDDYIFDLEERLIRVGADLLIKSLIDFSSGRIEPVPQKGEPFHAPLIKKEDGKIDWEKDAVFIYNKVRALARWPVAFSFLRGIRISIHKAIPVRNINQGKPGEIIKIAKEELLVQTGDGVLSLIEIQRSGKKRLHVKDFLAGARLKVGDFFEN